MTLPSSKDVLGPWYRDDYRSWTRGNQVFPSIVKVLYYNGNYHWNINWSEIGQAKTLEEAKQTVDKLAVEKWGFVLEESLKSRFERDSVV